MAFADTAELAVHLTLDDKFSRQIRGAGSSLTRFEGSVKKVGKGIGQIGAGFARAGLIAGGAAVTGIAAAAKAAIDFQDAFAGVRKTVDEKELTAAGLSFDKLALSFRKMATEIPIAATTFAAIGEQAGALGIKAKDIEEFTRTVALLGVTTNLTTDQAAEDLGKIGTILGLTGKGFQNFADILVNLGNKGASTESEIIEITKRFAASGKQAGLSVPQILAFSSAIASAGAEPEAAGSSLSRLFGNLITETALASKKGQAFARITGKSFKDFSKIVKKDTVGAMLTFLKSLKGLSKFQQQKALKAVGITNVRDRNAILLLAQTYDKNLIPALKNANESTNALSIEAQKRFDTIRSKLELFKNQITEAGIEVGEGFLPALGRATDKLKGFLALDTTKAGLKSLGEDIGKAIDAIDWQEVLDGAKKLVGFAKDAFFWADKLFKAFSALPGPVKEMAAAFVITNKLSGGLIGSGVGNVVGGLSETIIRSLGSKIPGIGGAFVQPVFVTNMPVGGLGGGVGAGAGSGLGSKLGTLVTAAIVLPIVAEIADAIHEQIKAPPDIPASQLSWPWGPKNTPTILPGLFGPNGILGGSGAGATHREGGPTSGLSRPLPVVVTNPPKPAPAPPTHNLLGAGWLTSILTHPPLNVPGPGERVRPLHGELQPGLVGEKIAALTSAEQSKGEQTIAAVTTAGTNTQAAVRTGASTVAGAVRASRPIITVGVHIQAYQVTKSVTIQERYGSGNGSSGQDHNEHGH